MHIPDEVRARLVAAAFWGGAIYGRFASRACGLWTVVLACILFFDVELWAITGRLRSFEDIAHWRHGKRIAAPDRDGRRRCIEIQSSVRISVAAGAGFVAIFVAHVIFFAAVRVALLVLGVENLALHAAAGVLAGIFGPLCLYLIAKRLGMERIAGF